MMAVPFKAYRCLDCGYVYDENKEFPKLGIKCGTPFEKLPKDWVCPVCRAKKTMFVVND